MKLFLRILSIIIEIIVAVAIFIMVTQKTPLFDRAIPGRSSGFSTGIQVNETNTKTTIQTNNKPSTGGSETDKTIISVNKDFSSETIIDKPVVQGLSCKSPRGSIVTDGNSIIAYRTQRANSDNKCYSEIRICQNGKLGGNFIYKTCDYVIDGQLIKSDGTREDTIAGASNSNQQLINLSKFYKKVQSTPKEYIQPQPYKDSATLTTSQAKSQKMDNSKIITNQDLTDTLDQTTTQEDHSTDKDSCRTPRGKTIAHGSFVYAYNYPTNTLGQSCSAQKRSCNDGTLGGTYRYESCRFNTNSTSSQAVFYSQPSTNYRGIVSPYSPYVRPISDSIRDTLLRSHKNISNTSTSQNYIEISNCLTPRGSTVPNGGHITAYRLPTSTANSLCNSESRICRSGTLGGTYRYPSCTSSRNTISTSSHETWLEKNIKSIGKDADNVRGWVKGWFK